jgi:maltose-binding protein MalE
MRYLKLILTGAVLLAIWSCSSPRDLPLVAQTGIPRGQSPAKGPAVSPEASLPAVSGTVTLWHSWSEGETPVLVQTIAEFQSRYPGVQFDVLYIPAENFQAKLESAVAQGKGPTLWFGPAEWGPPLYDAGLVADLSDMASPGLLQSLNQPALGSVQYKNATIGLPYTIQGVVLYRNRKVISKPAATFDELVALAQSTAQGDLLGADLERSFSFSGAHLDGIGGKLMDEHGAPAFDDAKGVAWLELLRSFEKAGPTEFLSDHDLEVFEAGKAGFIIDGTWNMNALSQALGAENLSIDPWPAYQDGRLSGYVKSDVLFLSSKAGESEQAAALKFMEYFLSPPAQLRLTQIDRIPAAGTGKVTDPLMLQAIAALAGGTTYPSLPQMGTYAAQMDVALRSVLEDGADPASALEAAARAIRAAQAVLANPVMIPTP